MSAELRAMEIFNRLGDKKNVVGAEIGVAVGQTSEVLLKRPDLFLYMIDSWAPETEQTQSYKDSGDWHAHCSLAEQDAHYQTAMKVTEFASLRREVLRMTSLEASKILPDQVLDFVFIDGDHSYEGCKLDIEVWRPKVKTGGLLGGHDYGHTPTDKPWTTGPKKAVDEFVSQTGLKLSLGMNYTWFVNV